MYVREREKEGEGESARTVRVCSKAPVPENVRIAVHSSSMASSHSRSDHRFADWMSSLPQSMHTIPLTNLAIPGRCCFSLTTAHHCFLTGVSRVLGATDESEAMFRQFEHIVLCAL